MTAPLKMSLGQTHTQTEFVSSFSQRQIPCAPADYDPSPSTDAFDRLRLPVQNESANVEATARPPRYWPEQVFQKSMAHP